MSELEISAQQMPALTPVEMESATSFYILGTGVVPRAGATLIKTTHHYLSSSENRKRHKAIEKQVFAAESPDAKAWRAVDTAEWQDLAWHKVPHSVEADLLMLIASDPSTAARLNASKIGAMAVGIPAMEDEMSRAGSYVQIWRTMHQVVGDAGHVVTYDRLVGMFNAISALPLRWTAANRPVIAAWSGRPAARPDAGETTRASTIRRYLIAEMEAAKPRVAFLFGWYRALCADEGIREGTEEGSLLGSWSLKKAVYDNIPMANKGTRAYRAVLADDRRVVEAGHMVVHSFTD
jgi:hypothetical protein